MDEKKNQIFYDPDQKRWPRIKYIGLTIFSLIFLLLFVFIVSLFIGARLQNIPLTTTTHASCSHDKAPSLLAKQNNNPTLIKQEELAIETLKLPSTATTQIGPYQPKRIVFLPSKSNMGIISLNEHVKKIDIVIGEWLHLQSEYGDISEEYLPDALIKEISSRNHAIKFIPMLDNNILDANLNKLLPNPTARNQLVHSLLTYVKKNHFGGISISFNNVSVQNKHNLVLFMQELARSFHAQNLPVFINVAANADEFDYKQLAQAVNYICLQLFDEHWAASKPGPIASTKWFSDTLKLRLKEIPAEKLIINLANHGYDWSTKTDSAEQKSFVQFAEIAQKYAADITFDPVSLNPTFQYKDAKNKLHSVWFLDAVTAFNQLSMASASRPYGFALWQLGTEDPSFWNIPLQFPLLAITARALQKIDLRYAFNFHNSGAAIVIPYQNPTAGKRQIKFDDKNNFILSERYETLPTTYQIDLSGRSSPRKLALTFDDGPNATYTSKILDILKATHTKATFFIIGGNALDHPELLQRAFSEGHDIGNHTFTHPDITKISDEQLLLELFATRRFLETVIGRKTLLFRPPYGLDTHPETPDELKAIMQLNKFGGSGYIAVTSDVDSEDWKEPGVNTIIRNVLHGVLNDHGSIITLHDAGGNSRQQTVAALPIIIASLKNSGYEFVTISELLGKSKHVVMPIVPNSLNMFFDRIGFSLLKTGHLLTKLLFIFSVVALLRLFVISVIAIFQIVTKKPQPPLTTDFSVSVFVPAHNEATVITKTIDSLLAARHPKDFEIIIIDDGSTDSTLEIVTQKFGQNPLVKILSQPNSGKAKALMYAMAESTSDIIITIDADTICDRDTIMNLLPPFMDPKTGAVAGTIRVGNQINLLTRWQTLEYVTVQNLDRRAFMPLNAIPVVPGALGAWRRTAMLEAGAFTQDTLAEDFDLTLKIRKLGYFIAFSATGVGYTEVPDTISGLLKQRYRWMFGTLQCLWKQIGTLFRPRYGTLGSVAIPNMILSTIFQLVAPFIDLIFILTLISIGLDTWYHPADFVNENSIQLLVYYLIFTCADLLSVLIAFLLDGKEKKSLLLWLLFQRFCYRQLMYYVVIRTLLSALRGRPVWWGKPQRKNTAGIV